MSFVFTPPTLQIVPQVSIAETRYGPPTSRLNPLGYRLMRWFPEGFRGVNVFKMKDGTYRISQAVAGVTAQIEEPYPDTDTPVNDAISSAWFPGGPGGVGGSGPGGQIVYVVPGIAVTYQGGHSYRVTSAEAADLTAVGFGPYIT